MSSKNIKGSLNGGAKVVPIKKSQNLVGKIFTIKFTEKQQAYTVYSRPVRESCDKGNRAENKSVEASASGQDLFFELWDFSDIPFETRTGLM